MKTVIALIVALIAASSSVCFAKDPKPNKPGVASNPAGINNDGRIKESTIRYYDTKGRQTGQDVVRYDSKSPYGANTNVIMDVKPVPKNKWDKKK